MTLAYRLSSRSRGSGGRGSGDGRGGERGRCRGGGIPGPRWSLALACSGLVLLSFSSNNIEGVRIRGNLRDGRGLAKNSLKIQRPVLCRLHRAACPHQPAGVFFDYRDVYWVAKITFSDNDRLDLKNPRHEPAREREDQPCAVPNAKFAPPVPYQAHLRLARIHPSSGSCHYLFPPCLDATT